MDEKDPPAAATGVAAALRGRIIELGYA
jgi:hypothetical protein